MKISNLSYSIWDFNSDIAIDHNQVYDVVFGSGDYPDWLQLILDKDNDCLYYKTPALTLLVYQNGAWIHPVEEELRSIAVGTTGNDLTNKSLINWLSKNAKLYGFWVRDPNYRWIQLQQLNFIGSFDYFPDAELVELNELDFANITNLYYVYVGNDNWITLDSIGIFDYDNDFIPTPLLPHNTFGTYMAEKVTDLMPENEG